MSPASYPKLGLGGTGGGLVGEGVADLDDLAPGLDQTVVGAGLLGPLVALADLIEPIGEIARHVGLIAELLGEPRRRRLGARPIEPLDEVLAALPDGLAVVPERQAPIRDDDDVCSIAARTSSTASPEKACRLSSTPWVVAEVAQVGSSGMRVALAGCAWL